MRPWSLVLGAVLASAQSASAMPKTVVVASGDCRNADLLTGMTGFDEALRRSWVDELFAPEQVISLLRPRPTMSLEAVQRQIESARTSYYVGTPNEQQRALELARQAVSELEKMPPQAKVWPTFANALTLQGTVLKALGSKAESDELFARVLRIDASYQLDINLFTPSTQEVFERIRLDHQRKLRKSSLSVQSSPGAEVFIDGRSFGKAPLRLQLAPGTYRMTAVNAEQLSFPHLVTVPKEGSALIDLTFEGALASTTPLCLSSADAPAEALAQRLADALSAERVVVFWREARDGPPFYRALILRRGVKEREGGVQTSFDDRRAIDQLAEFVVTGRGGGIVEVNGAMVGSPPVAAKPTAASEPVAAEPPPPPPKAEAPLVAAPVSPAPRVIGYSLVGVGLATASVGAVVFMLADADRARLATLNASGPLPAIGIAEHTEALAVQARVHENRLLSLGLIGTGAGAAISGALLLWLFPPLRAENQTVAIVPVAGGVGLALGRSF